MRSRLPFYWIDKYYDYYDITYLTAEDTMCPILIFKDKNTGDSYIFKLGGLDIQCECGSFIEMRNKLDQLIREVKLNELGI